jgi:hypothetical protein
LPEPISRSGRFQSVTQRRCPMVDYTPHNRPSEQGRRPYEHVRDPAVVKTGNTGVMAAVVLFVLLAVAALSSGQPKTTKPSTQPFRLPNPALRSMNRLHRPETRPALSPHPMHSLSHRMPRLRQPPTPRLPRRPPQTAKPQAFHCVSCLLPTVMETQKPPGPPPGGFTLSREQQRENSRRLRPATAQSSRSACGTA